MAIYKPSNCTPFLTSWDLTHKQQITCEINTSNQIITGYKLKLYDSKNNVLFEGVDYTLSTDTTISSFNNTWLNGSTLILPFIVTSNDERNNNTIYYNSGNGKWYAGKQPENVEDEIEVNIKNGTINQPYKWEITLAQGDLDNSSGAYKPLDIKYYDMNLVSANVLGSTPDRIQGWLSENIYSDYYVQLYTEDFDAIGNRVRISSYDHTYGYLYPQEGYLNNQNIEDASYFKIFRDTNDPSVVSTARLVNNISHVDLNKVKINNIEPVAISVDFSGYLIQKYPGANFGPESIALSNYIPNASGNIDSNRTILFVNVGGNGDSQSDFSFNQYNGVLQFVSAAYSSTDNATTVKWLRPANFDKYADYINRLICVESEGKNYGNTSNGLSVGTINSTQIKFYEEQAIGLYPVYHRGTKELEPIVELKEISLVGDSSPYAYDQIERVHDNVNILNIITSTPFKQVVKPVTKEEAIQQNLYYKDDDENKCFPITNTMSDADYAALAEVYQKDLMMVVNTTLAGGSYYRLQIDNSSSSKVIVPLSFNYLQDYSEVFKNTTEKTYIKPFIGLSSEMKFFYGDELENNVDIITLDNKANWENKYSPTWYITHSVLPYSLKASGVYNDGIPYAIRSFFKISDENPFYVYNYPEIQIILDEIESGDNTKVKNRFVTARGVYTQAQNKSWKSFQFVLTDLAFPTEPQYGDKIYSGEMSSRFYGLQNKHKYTIDLIVEDELGNLITKTEEFTCNPEIVETIVDFDVKYNCQTHSNDIEVGNNTYILPTNGEGVSPIYNISQVQSNELSTMILESTSTSPLMAYDKLMDGESSIPCIFGIFDDLGNKITKLMLNSKHFDLDQRFAGNIIKYSFNDESNNEYVISLNLPDEYLSKDDDIPNWTVNQEDRYTIKAVVKKNDENFIGPVNVHFYFKNRDGETWYTNNNIASAYVPGLYNIASNIDYLDTVKFEGSVSSSVETDVFINIRDQFYNSNGEIKQPFKMLSGTTGNELNYWSDNKIYFGHQNIPTTDSDYYINVFKQDTSSDTGCKIDTWEDDDGSGNNYYWKDTDSVSKSMYSNVNNSSYYYTGRQHIRDFTLIFSIQAKNYTENNNGNDGANWTFNCYIIDTSSTSE